MQINNRFNVIFWDFDGVLMNSNKIRDLGFEKVLAEYPKEEVEQLMKFHKKNGGLSRYVKFRYFFEEIRGGVISEKEVQQWADRFSVMMKELLINSSLLIDETLQYVKENHDDKKMHIVSGSDQNELRYICESLDIDKYFDSIHGSPTPKMELVNNLLGEHQYNVEECLLIGDSINDYEAAESNSIYFLGYGNPKIKELSTIS